MECRYCQAWNESDEHRCTRCGRRLNISAPHLVSDTPPVMGSAAPALVKLPRASESPKTAVYQPLLFRDANGPKVIPIPTLTPLRLKESEEPVRQPARPARAQPRRSSNSQQSLDFHGTPKSIGTHVEAVSYCDAPVALP